jgi:hypothetical protein
MAELTIYPCQDRPATCGHSRWELPAHVCIYPTCWCGDWLIGKPMTNKTIDKGQPFKVILYRGSSSTFAEMVCTHFQNNQIVALADSAHSVHIINITASVAGLPSLEFGLDLFVTYQVELIGEIV